MRELICDNDMAIKPSKNFKVQWNETLDVFYLFKRYQAKDLSPPKINILKILATFYDPLGLYNL